MDTPLFQRAPIRPLPVNDMGNFRCERCIDPVSPEKLQCRRADHPRKNTLHPTQNHQGCRTASHNLIRDKGSTQKFRLFGQQSVQVRNTPAIKRPYSRPVSNHARTIFCRKKINNPLPFQILHSSSSFHRFTRVDHPFSTPVTTHSPTAAPSILLHPTHTPPVTILRVLGFVFFSTSKITYFLKKIVFSLPFYLKSHASKRFEFESPILCSLHTIHRPHFRHSPHVNPRKPFAYIFSILICVAFRFLLGALPFSYPVKKHKKIYFALHSIKINLYICKNK